jgi:hypothetical protein
MEVLGHDIVLTKRHSPYGKLALICLVLAIIEIGLLKLIDNAGFNVVENIAFFLQIVLALGFPSRFGFPH